MSREPGIKRFKILNVTDDDIFSQQYMIIHFYVPTKANYALERYLVISIVIHSLKLKGHIIFGLGALNNCKKTTLQRKVKHYNIDHKELLLHVIGTHTTSFSQMPNFLRF